MVGGSQRLVPYIREHLISRQVFIMVFCTGSFVSYSLALYLDQWISLHHWTKNDTKNTISGIHTESPSISLGNRNVHLGLFYVEDPQLIKGKERLETNVYVQQYIQQHTIPVWVHMSRFIAVSAMIFQVTGSMSPRRVYRPKAKNGLGPLGKKPRHFLDPVRNNAAFVEASY